MRMRILLRWPEIMASFRFLSLSLFATKDHLETRLILPGASHIRTILASKQVRLEAASDRSLHRNISLYSRFESLISNLASFVQPSCCCLLQVHFNFIFISLNSYCVSTWTFLTALPLFVPRSQVLAL